jgi:hypothetical protein
VNKNIYWSLRKVPFYWSPRKVPVYSYQILMKFELPQQIYKKKKN